MSGKKSSDTESLLTMPTSSQQLDYGTLANNNTNSAGNRTEDDTDFTTTASSVVTVTYSSLVGNNTNFRYYWLSFVVNRLGDWLTLLASISFIGQRVGTDSPNYHTLISVLLVCKSFPNVLCMPLGGVLADSYDRRQLQIALNAASAGLVVVFVWAYHHHSVPGVLVATFVQDALEGLYAPAESAMIPQLVLCKGNSNNGNGNSNGSRKQQQRYDQELKKATTLMSLTWSLMAALGSALGGVLVAAFGIQGCYWIDSLTYIVAMLLLTFGVEGKFNVVDDVDDTDINVSNKEEAPLTLKRRLSLSERKSSFTRLSLSERKLSLPMRSKLIMARCDGNPLMGAGIELHGPNTTTTTTTTTANSPTTSSNSNSSNNRFVQGLVFAFVQEPLVGAYALLKGSMSLSVAAQSILNISFSEDDDQSRASLKLGSLFACIGIGSLIGSYISDVFSDLSKPKGMARICILGFLFIALGSGLTGVCGSDHFVAVGVSQVVRAIGASMIWVDSSLLLQKFTPPALLGRVTSIDTTAALFFESVSNLGVGLLLDRMKVSPEHASYLLSGLGCFFFVLWMPLAFKAPKKPH